MKTYKIQFIGRRIGAIGSTYVNVETVESDNRENAILKLYETFEHITAIIFLN